MAARTEKPRKGASRKKAALWKTLAEVPVADLFREPRTVAVRIGRVEARITKSNQTLLIELMRKMGLLEDPDGPRFSGENSEQITSSVEVLSAEDVDMPALESSARERSLAFRQRFLRNAVTVAQARKELGVASSQTIHNWLKQKKILGLPDRHRIMIPTWQFDPGTKDGIVNGLDAVLRAINSNEYGVAYWLTSPNPHLDEKKPIDLLRAGKSKEVLEEAQGVGVGQ